jgi:hypothetical protein
MNIRNSVRVAALSLASAAVAASAALAVATPASASTEADPSQTVTQIVSPQSGSHHRWKYDGRYYDRHDCYDRGHDQVDEDNWSKFRCDRHRYWDHDDHEYRYYWDLYYQEYDHDHEHH